MQSKSDVVCIAQEETPLLERIPLLPGFLRYMLLCTDFIASNQLRRNTKQDSAIKRLILSRVN